MMLSGRVSQGTCAGQQLYAFIHESTTVSNPLICLLPAKGMDQCTEQALRLQKSLCTGHAERPS